MSIRAKLINEYPLTKKIDCDFDCYEVINRRYVLFYDEIINSSNMELLLEKFDEAIRGKVPNMKRTLIVVGKTDEQFKPADLFFFNGVDTFIVYYLIGDNNEIYFNNKRVFFFSSDWNKIVDRFNEILK